MNREKSELDPKQVFNFAGYQFDLKEGQKVRPSSEHWQALTTKIQTILSGPVYPVWQFMSIHSNRKTSPPRSAPYEAHTVAQEVQLEGTQSHWKS